MEEKMSAFDPGQHVIVEIDDGQGNKESVAGYLMNYLDDGWVINMTHKEFRVVYTVPAETSESIREQLRGKGTMHLRVAAVLSGSLVGFLAKREDVIEFLAGIFEDKLLSGYTDKWQLRELKHPVTKFFSHDIVRTMEVTTDRNIQEEMQVFDADTAIDEIFKNQELTSEEGDGKIEG